MTDRFLTIQQLREAKALYFHLLNHPEVKTTPINPGLPMCKICYRTAREILDDEGDVYIKD